MAQSVRISIKIQGLRRPQERKEYTIVQAVKIDTSRDELLQLIVDAGYVRPDIFEEALRDLQITVVEGDSNYDTTSPGGLQISRMEPSCGGTTNMLNTMASLRPRHLGRL
ncbi:hypothetical protein B0H19DRAFT_296046 [Mycena capillaripes]|nr:hypothetical protein B0H19DRAFT_296046 [Mycena capillaripes]